MYSWQIIEQIVLHLAITIYEIITIEMYEFDY